MDPDGEDFCQKWTDISDEELNAAAIRDTLSAIKDDLWVAAAVADRFINDVELFRSMLETGLKRTEGAAERVQNSLVLQDTEDASAAPGQSSSSADDDVVSYFREEPSDARLCLIRSSLLDRKDRLDTFVEMCEASATSLDEVVSDVEWEDDPWVDATDAGPEQRQTVGSPPLPLSNFLASSLVDSACMLASQEAFGPLQVLFRRHLSSLWPFRFHILSYTPHHALPSSIQELLPKVDLSCDMEQQPSGEPWRAEPDWCELLRVQTALTAAGIFSRTYPPPLLVDESLEPMSSQGLASWYRQRAHDVLSTTGMVDVALLTVQHAISQGVPTLDELGEELILLSRLVYDAQATIEDGPDEDWTLDQWENMDSLDIIRSMLSHSSPETLVSDIRKLVIPYLFVLEARAERAGKPDPSLPSRLLSEYVLNSSLAMVARIFEESKPTLPPAQRLISDDEDMARFALACLYGSDSLDEWHLMSQIFECLPAWNIAPSDDDPEDAVEMTITSLGAFVTPTTARPRCLPSDLLLFFRPLPLAALSHALDILDVHLESGEIFSRWDVPAPLRWFLQSINDKSAQRTRAVRMARRLGANRQVHTQEDWEWLLEDMLKLARTGDNGLRGAFGLLSQVEILSIFLSGLLSTGQLDMAKTLLRSRKSALSLNDHIVEEMCMIASREFYDNASSGNYNFGDMKLAYDCLSIPPPSEAIVREQEFIEATSRIASFNVETRPGVPLSPIEIRLTKDRMSLVSRVLSSNSDAYKYKEVILELVDKFGFRGDAVARVKALAMITDTALQVEDFAYAFKTSEAMVEIVSQLCQSSELPSARLQEAKEVCWVSCFQLGRQIEFPDATKKLRLLGHSLEFCPPDRLPEILAAWRRLEKDDIEQQIERREDNSTRRNSAVSVTTRGSRARQPSTLPPSLASRLQNIHLPKSPLGIAEGAAIADTFSRVASKLPFAKSRPHSAWPEGKAPEQPQSEDGGWPSLDREEVSAQASRALQRGIGWLIGADE
ncbi:Sec39-domain-containing protein [Gloeopeniophorella convolvens]|nr:Sec39-domain-containing protein [Gloeopeniophorella convolvens]